MGFWDSFGNSLMRGYAFSKQLQEQQRKEELYNLLKPYIQDAQDAQKTTIQSNPNYRLTDFITKPTTSDPNKLLPMGDFAPKQQDPQSPTTLKQAMPMNDWMSKYGWLVAKQVGADALPYAIRTGDENRLASLVKGGLAMNADQADTSRRKWFETNRDTGLKLQDSGRKLQETGVQYGTNQSLTDNQNTLAKQYGFPDLKFDYAQTGGYKPAVAQSQIDRNNSTIEKNNSVTWRNYNKPLVSTKGGNGNGGLTVAQQRQDEDKLRKAKALMSVYSDSGKLVNGEYVPYTPAEQAKFNDAAIYIQTHDPTWQSGGQGAQGNDVAPYTPVGQADITPQSLQQDQGAVWYDRTYRSIKAKTGMTDEQIQQYLTGAINGKYEIPNEYLE